MTLRAHTLSVRRCSYDRRKLNTHMSALSENTVWAVASDEMKPAKLCRGSSTESPVLSSCWFASSSWNWVAARQTDIFFFFFNNVIHLSHFNIHIAENSILLYGEVYGALPQNTATNYFKTCVRFFDPDDGRSKLLLNVGLYLPMYTTSYTRMYFNKETVGEHLVHIPDNQQRNILKILRLAGVNLHPMWNKPSRLFTCIATDCDIIFPTKAGSWAFS